MVVAKLVHFGDILAARLDFYFPDKRCAAKPFMASTHYEDCPFWGLFGANVLAKVAARQTKVTDSFGGQQCFY